MWQRCRFIVLVLAAIAAPGALANGGSERPSFVSGVESDYELLVAAIEAQEYERALGLAEAYTRNNPADADGWNWLGFTRRKIGALGAAFVAYERALAIDPRHRGAHEYVGEAHLAAGQPARAMEHLKTLQGLCPQGCEELQDLEKAISAYRLSHPGG